MLGTRCLYSLRDGSRVTYLIEKGILPRYSHDIKMSETHGGSEGMRLLSAQYTMLSS